MLRKVMLAALAVAAVGLSMPQAAQAGGGHGGGWGHGGGGWGHGGGGWGHGGHWHGGGFWPGFGIGAGYYGGYYGYGPYYYGPGPAYYSEDGGYGGCYVVRKRVRTPAGWRIRRVDVCE